MEPNYRRCLSCRRVAPKAELIRVVREHSTCEVRLHQGMGRSAYLCPNSECIYIAQKKRRLERALKTAVPAEIYDVLNQSLLDL